MLDEFALVSATWQDPTPRRPKLNANALAVLVFIETRLGDVPPTWPEAEERLAVKSDTLRQAGGRLVAAGLLERTNYSDAEVREQLGATGRERFTAVTPLGRQVVWKLLEERPEVLRRHNRARRARSQTPPPRDRFNEGGGLVF